MNPFCITMATLKKFGLTGRRLYPSGPAVADGHFFPLDDHRHLALAAGKFEHGRHLFVIGFHVEIVVVVVGLPGAAGVRSPGLSINSHLVAHGIFLRFRVKSENGTKIP